MYCFFTHKIFLHVNLFLLLNSSCHTKSYTLYNSYRFVNISWNDIPCSGQNGPIIGYMIHYTNTTFSDTVNTTQPYYYLTRLKVNTSYITYYLHDSASHVCCSSNIHVIITSNHSKPLVIVTTVFTVAYHKCMYHIVWSSVF